MENLLFYAVEIVLFALGGYLAVTKGEVKHLGGYVLLIVAAVLAVAKFAGELTRDQATVPTAILVVVAAIIACYASVKMQSWLAQPLGDIKSSSN